MAPWVASCLLAAAVPCLAVVHDERRLGGPCIFLFPAARSTPTDDVSARHGLGAHTYVHAEAAAVAVGNGTGRDTCEHMPRRQAVVARASGASLPFTLPAPIMHVSTVPRASAHACMCQCLSRLAPGIAKPSALHSDIPSSNDVAS